MKIELNPIGIIHTPYKDDAPFMDYQEKEGDFYIELDKEFKEEEEELKNVGLFFKPKTNVDTEKSEGLFNEAKIAFIEDRYDDAEDLLEKSGFESIYVLDKPVDLSVNQLKAYLWADYYPLCKTCKKKCKQSHIVLSLHCDDYIKA